ncbi:MAG: hypothetical protein WAU75_09310 [Solirubrobacteraceae bacterium]
MSVVALENPAGGYVPGVWVRDHSAARMLATNLLDEGSDQLSSETPPDRGRLAKRVINPAIPGLRAERVGLSWIDKTGIPLTPANAPTTIARGAAAFNDREHVRCLLARP